MSRLGILGGTFDPIHLGHLILASYAADDLSLDRVLFMPAQTPPHKLGDPVSPSEHRTAMIERAIEPDPRYSMSLLDMSGSRPSYTSKLLERLNDVEPDSELYFLIGADSLRDFPSWHEPERILELARLGVARRPGTVIDDSVFDALPTLRDRATVFSSPLIDISATSIRERVAAGKPISWTVPGSVEAYIRTHGLYLPGNIPR